MAVVTSDFLVQAYRGLHAIYRDTYEATEPLWPGIAMEVPSDTLTEDYSWLAEVPGMKEWVDERTLEDLKQWNYSIKNKDWEDTIAVDRNTYEDDKLGQIKPRIQDLAVAAKVHPDELVFALLAAGFSTACFDGQYYFDNDHPLRDGSVQANLIANVLDETGLQAAITAMRRLKGYTGRPLNIVPDTLVVPPEKESSGKKLLFADRNAAGATNIMKGSLERLIVSPFLSNTSNWFVCCTKRPLKPIMLQMRKRPQFVALDRPDDYNAFMKKQFLYGVDGRYNVGYALYQLAVGSTGAGV
ncbi:MAG: Mu-like prophage major head subunit gpT family protein [Candidatus Desulforudaceae bacterium]